MINNDNKHPEITLIRPQELAEAFGVTIATLYRIIDQPDFPPRIHIGKRAVAFRKDQIIQYLKDRTENKD